jgi:hypothetical protein
MVLILPLQLAFPAVFFTSIWVEANGPICGEATFRFVGFFE